jgi:hypothetical protein
MRSTAEEVQAALNTLKPITQQGSVTVTQDHLDGASNYNVTFVFALPSKTELLKPLFISNGASATVTQSQKGESFRTFYFRFWKFERF